MMGALAVGMMLFEMSCTPGTMRLSNGAVSREMKEPPRCALAPGVSTEPVRAELYQNPEEIYKRLEKKRQRGGAVPSKPGLVLAKTIFFWDGTLKRITFLKGDPIFYEAVISMVEEWKLKEHRVNGCPVETYSVLRFAFNHVPNSTPLVASSDTMNLDIKDRSGRVFKLSDYQKSDESNPGQKRRLLLSFVSVHCEPCREELPVLKQYQALFQDSTQVVLIVLEDEDALSTINELLPPESTPFPVVVDRGYEIYTQFLGSQGDIGIPFNLLIDENGKGVSAAAGYKNSTEFFKRFR